MAQMVKNPLACRRPGFDSLEKETATTPVFWPGEARGQRSVVGYSPWSRKEWDMSEQLTLSLFFFTAKDVII